MGRQDSRKKLLQGSSLANSLSGKLPTPASITKENNNIHQSVAKEDIVSAEAPTQVETTIVESSTDEVVVETPVTKEDKPKKKAKKKIAKNPFIKKVVNKTRTVTIRADLDDMLTDLFTDPETDKKIVGAKGEMSKLISNALRREFVAMGVADESLLDEIEEY